MKSLAEKMFTAKELLPKIYGIASSGVMMYLVVGDAKAMLIDTAYGFADVREVIRKITDKPLIVLNTHGHIDHSGGNFYFDDPVYIHEADVEVYYRHSEPEFHRYGESALKLFQHILFWKTILPKHPEEHDPDRMSFNRFAFLHDGDEFDLGGLTAKVYEIPGHTKGSVAVLIPEKRLIFTTDGANPNTWLFLPESDSLSVYLNSLRKIEGLDFDHILTGHSSNLFTRADLQKWINVAEHPDVKHAKPIKENSFAPGTKIVQVWAKGSKNKGPSVQISTDRINTI